MCSFAPENVFRWDGYLIVLPLSHTGEKPFSGCGFVSLVKIIPGLQEA